MKLINYEDSKNFLASFNSPYNTENLSGPISKALTCFPPIPYKTQIKHNKNTNKTIKTQINNKNTL